MEHLALVKIGTLTALSFILAMSWTPVLSHFLYKYKLGKNIRSSAKTPIFSKLHSKKSGTPTMGGVLVWLTVFVLAAVLFVSWRVWETEWLGFFNFVSRSETWLPLGAMLLGAAVGLVDDYFTVTGKGVDGGGLSIPYRLGLYTVIAIVGAYWFYVKLGFDTIHVPFFGDFTLGWWYIPLFIFVIVATSFSVNETDGLDGLAGGVMMSMFGAYGAIAFIQGNYDLATLCGVIAGSLLAFLWFNINPARFFMGDTGSMSLGITLGIIAMLTDTLFFLPIIGLVLVVESLSVIIQVLSKKFRRKKVFLSAPIHHHFEALGWSEPKVVMRFWVISGVGVTLGLILFLLDLGITG
ncbi:MAG: phospho-N-acetylmuramoyl-pentapeptide-transferase [Patescibacteria group bacterium]